VAPVVAALAGLPVPISVDTSKAEVAEAALAAGAEVVNDVSGGRLDPRIREVCAAHGAVMIVSHLRGAPRDMQARIEFRDVFEEVADELAEALAQARAAGVTQLIADPGLGFGKTAEHNLVLIARAGELGERLGVPVMLGPSRKSFLGKLAGRPVEDRLAATLGAVVAGALAGAAFVRVHDVAPAREALAVADAVMHARSSMHARTEMHATEAEKRPAEPGDRGRIETAERARTEEVPSRGEASGRGSAEPSARPRNELHERTRGPR
jgi:dihydropteroate synthase